MASAFAQNDAETARQQGQLVADLALPQAFHARRPDGRRRGESARLPELLRPAPGQAELDQPTRVPRDGEMKSQTEFVGVFPNVAASRGLVGAFLLEQNDEWSHNAPAACLWRASLSLAIIRSSASPLSRDEAGPKRDSAGYCKGDH